MNTNNSSHTTEWINVSPKHPLIKCSLLALATVLFSGTGSTWAAAEMETTSVSEEKPNPWQFTAAAYFWGASVKGETRAGENVDVGFSDILDKLKFAGMGMFAVRNGRWSVVTDLIYLKLEDDLNQTPVSKEEVTMDIWITQYIGAYTVVVEEDFTVDVLAGARYLSLDVDVDIDVGGIALPLDLNVDKGLWNGIVGVKGRINLPNQWYAVYYFDAGTGDTKSTYQAMGTLGYQFDKLALVTGYRYLKWNFDKSDTLGRVLDELILQGPFVGLSYRF